MPENPVPPPPPSRAGKPPPPPPPRFSGGAPMPPPSAVAMPPGIVPPPMGPAAAPPALKAEASLAIEQRIQEVERRFQEQENAKKTLETQIGELQRQLKEEHEKVILQSLKAREDEALGAKVEQQLREMQDKLRREKYEQELHDSRGKAESQIKDLERRIAEERETWMVALKNQLKEREIVEKEVEQTLTRRLHDFEQRYQDEKNRWAQGIRQKEDETAQLRRQMQFEIEALKEHLEEKDEALDGVKEAAAQERRALEQQAQSETRLLQAQMESQMREASGWKAQIALLQNQLHQAEAQHQEARNRWQNQLAAQEDDFKREYGRRDQERVQYWENIVAQMRAEKETLRAALVHREEDVARLQMTIAEAARGLEIERGRWQMEAEKIRREAKEAAHRDVPALVQEQMESERKRLAEEHQQAIGHLKAQIHQAVESEKITAAKRQLDHEQALLDLKAQFHQQQAEHQRTVDDLKTQLHHATESEKLTAAKQQAEQERMGQETAVWKTQWQQMEEARSALAARADALEQELRETQKTLDRQKAFWAEETKRIQSEREKQTKEFLRRLAEVQLREASLREGTENATPKLECELRERQKAQEALVVSLEEQDRQSKGLIRAGRLIKRLVKAQSDVQSREREIRKTCDRLREAFGKVRAKIGQIQIRQQQKESDWADKETRWNNEKAEWAGKEAQWDRLKAELAEKKAQGDRFEAESAEKEAELANLKNELAKKEWRLTEIKNNVVASSAIVENAVGPAMSQAALTAIRQQMQEMKTLLTWLRPAKKPLGKAA